MVANEAAAILSPAAKKCGFKHKGYLCFEEDSQENVALRELLDKKLWKIPDRISDKAAFEEAINRSIGSTTRATGGRGRAAWRPPKRPEKGPRKRGRKITSGQHGPKRKGGVNRGLCAST